MTARYALYFSPRAAAAWQDFGNRALVGDARRYGFHATLRAPFRLKPGARVEDLIRDLDSWSAAQRAFVMPVLRVATLDDFVALLPEQPDPRLDAIAAACVQRFERFRAPLNAAELARRRRAPLSARQEELLQRWGYPHVLDQFRFHLSLTGALDGASVPAFEPPQEPMVFDAVSLFWEPAPGAPFRLLHRASFRSGGRLIYVVGPSGAGKDSLLGWVRRQLGGDAPVAFARRTITRPDDAGGEDHLPATPESFEAALARGEFAMDWEANGLRYGIGQEIRVWLAQGLTVVVSGSREYLPEARRRFPDLELVQIVARPEVLRERLVRRGREAANSIERRLTRRPLDADRPAAEFVNEGELDVAGRQLLSYLTS